MINKYKELKADISRFKSLIVAFSGGVDSSFLLRAANEVLGEKALGITVHTPYIADWEIEDAKKIAKEIGVRHKILKLPWLETIRTNPENRCYICKHALFTTLFRIAKDEGFESVAEGSNMNDLDEYRPGRKALKELGAVTPLLDAKLYKNEIRALSREFGLSTWNKPSYACLLTRFPHDYAIKEEEFGMVGRAEETLIKAGYGVIRVRFQDGLARIEMPREDALRFLNDDKAAKIVETLKTLGFTHITLDLPKIINL
jgi:uncharacterized protein